ncbi:hypothetical protein M752DRAFT_271093 [Aspergillus phoenicis ATCC 13157]|uniref:Uncharacterized protein n=1 Tax=Aspergillus phoenicis ATCC 13157 TaxID=1353007 RepID=A0A370P535_ASPPH|nr:hypothetical protein M752DRAFT_271093 [Aspergillus phoenicis ATCC 13157]
MAGPAYHQRGQPFSTRLARKMTISFAWAPKGGGEKYRFMGGDNGGGGDPAAAAGGGGHPRRQSGIEHFHHRMQHDQHNRKRAHDMQHLRETSIRFLTGKQNMSL